jgi:hypothetical protein
MQQVALPSLYERSRRRPVLTPPFPLLRRRDVPEVAPKGRKVLAYLLFGALMSGTLVLLGYEARVIWDSNPDVLRNTADTIKEQLR